MSTSEAARRAAERIEAQEYYSGAPSEAVISEMAAIIEEEMGPRTDADEWVDEYEYRLNRIEAICRHGAHGTEDEESSKQVKELRFLDLSTTTPLPHNFSEVMGLNYARQSRRERAAMAALTGLLSAHDRDGTWTGAHKECAEMDVTMADALLAALDAGAGEGGAQ